MTLDTDPDAQLAGGELPATRSWLKPILILIVVLAVACGAGAVGWLIGDHDGSSVAATSVDAGFARDMSTHHAQGVVMAGYTRIHTTNASVLLFANDIYDEQSFQIGQMQGWLDSWGLTRSSTIAQMAWMDGHAHLAGDGLMPGMATSAQITKLQSSTGNDLDVLFLQLMIHHHQGGLSMMQYAEQHASKAYVQNAAQKMEQAQSTEIVAMEQLLRQLGGTPLPAPAS